MDLLSLLTPVPPAARQHATDGSLGEHIRLFGSDAGTDLPEGTAVALVGIPEDRFTGRGGESRAPAGVRKALYELSNPFGDRVVTDLGDLKPGHTLNDTYCAVDMLVSYLRDRDIVTVLIGGSYDVTYGALLPAVRHERFLHWTSVHPHVFPEDYRYADKISPLSRILWTPGQDLEYTQVGGQKYLASATQWAHVEQYYDVLRLGVVREDLEMVEPYLRDSHVVSLSMTAVRYADAPETSWLSPNGFMAEEVCRLAFFAGTSPTCGVFSVGDMRPKGRRTLNVTACAAAQCIWHFLSGLSLRVREHPSENAANFQKYIVSLDQSGQTLHFLKSTLTGRWWMLLPGEEGRPPAVTACSQSDYERACNNEMPSRWCKLIRR